MGVVDLVQVECQTWRLTYLLQELLMLDEQSMNLNGEQMKLGVTMLWPMTLDVMTLQ
jgi:hypothetical protein